MDVSDDRIRVGKVEIARVVGVVFLEIYQNPYVSFSIKAEEAKEIGKAMIRIADSILKERDGHGKCLES